MPGGPRSPSLNHWVDITVKRFTIILLSALFFTLIFILIARKNRGDLGLIIVSSGFVQTNSSGATELVSTVSNAGPNILWTMVGIQTNLVAGWHESLSAHGFSRKAGDQYDLDSGKSFYYASYQAGTPA